MFSGRVASSVFMAALLVSALPNLAAAQVVGRVGGLVRDEAGTPIKGATVMAENVDVGQTTTATTDDKGRFVMIGLRAGRWRIMAAAPGFAPDGGEMPVRLGSPNPPIALTLKKTGPLAFGALAGIAGKDLQTDLSAADALFSQSRWDDALTAYKAILEKAPALPVINLQIAAAYRNKKDYDGAIAAYNALLKAEPDNAKAQVGIAMTSVERGDEKGAEETLLRAIENPNAGREVFYSLAEVKFSRNDIDEAIRWYEKASLVDPAWGKPIYKLGLCAIKKGDSAGAMGLMDRVIAVDPVSPEAALAKSSLESLKK